MSNSIINPLVVQGTDANPVLSETIDDGTARLKLRLKSGAASIAVGPTGTLDASLVEGVDITQTGVVSFPNGALPSADWSKNRVINGGFDIWQAGTSFSVANGVQSAYTADQWFVNNGYIGVPLTAAEVSAPAGFSCANALNVQATGAVVAPASIDICQRFEASALVDMDSKPSAISFDLNASTSAGTLQGQIFILSNSAPDNGTFSVGTVGSGLVFAIPVGSGRVVVPLSAAQTVGVKNGCQLYFRFTQTGATGNFNITIGAVKLEKGPVASPWSPKPIAQEWADCERFYRTGHVRLAANGTYVGGSVDFGIPMRATPTMTITDEVGNANTCTTAAGGNSQVLPGVGNLIANSAPPTQGFISDAIFSTAPGNWVGFNWTASVKL